MIKTKQQLAEAENSFQKHLQSFRADSSKKDWDEMWFLVYDCCKNMALGMLKFHTETPDEILYDRINEAVCKIMSNIKDGVNPTKLSSYCYLPTLGCIQGSKAQREDRERLSTVCFSDITDNEELLMDGVEDNNEALLIRIEASKSSLPYSQFLEELEDLTTAGYSLSDALDLLRKRENG